MIDEIDGPTQKTWIRVLVIVGIGIPILIEVITFAGLLSHSIGPATNGGTATPTSVPEGAAEGDEILTETEQRERITRATVAIADDGWAFRLTVNVSNTGGSMYELRLGPVTTRAGETVAGTVTTGKVEPGQAATVTGRWLLPSGQRPASITATVLLGDVASREHTVQLGDIPVSS